MRDLSKDMDKKIDLEMVGADTELDRQVLELIKYPLTYMVRNSADHGLESTEKRIELAKPEAGKIRLSAYHEGGHIIIEVSDDGAGLNAGFSAEKWAPTSQGRRGNGCGSHQYRIDRRQCRCQIDSTIRAMVDCRQFNLL